MRVERRRSVRNGTSPLVGRKTRSSTTAVQPSSTTAVQPWTSTAISDASFTHNTNGEFVGRDGFTWHKKPVDRNWGENACRSRFTVRPDIAQCSNPFDMFDFLIDSRMIHKIIEYSNKKLPRDEKPLTSIELRAFFGLLLLFGCIGKNDIDIAEIWSPQSIHHLDLASACMSRDRFKIISANLCFNDRDLRATRSDATNKNYYKIEEIFNIFRRNISSAAEPGENITIDEEFYAFRG